MGVEKMRADETTRRHSLLSLWKRHPFRLHIAVFFTTMVFLFGVVLAWSSYIQGRNLVLSSTERVFERIEREIQSEMLHMRTLVEAVVTSMSRVRITDAATFNMRMQFLEGMAETLNQYSMLESIYVGYYNGDFFQLHALRNDADRRRFAAPRHAAYRLQSIERGTRQRRFKLLDPALNVILDLPVPPDYRFDPRIRPWYVEAMKTNGPVQTAPYLFFTTREVGQTIARRAEHGRAVVGADITLKQLSETLALARPSPSSQLAVFGEDRSVIAQSEPLRIQAVDAKGNPDLPRIADLSPVLAAATQGPLLQTRTKKIEVDAREWLVRIAPVTQTTKGMTYLVVATPSDELLTEARVALQRNLWLALVLVLLSAPLTWWIARRIAANLNALTDQAAAIRRFNFKKPAPLRSRIIEILDMGFAMGQMRITISKFMDITTALSAERNFDRLLRRVLQEARDAAGAEGGVIYLLAEDGRTLKPADQSWNEGATAGDENLPGFSMWDESNPVARAARSTEAHGTHTLAPQRSAGLEFLDARFDRLPVLLVTVPLLDRGGAAIGVLCLFLRGSSAQPSQERLALVRAFAGAGGVAIDNQRLLAAHKALLNSLIELIARAIDAKSHYTAGHCERVPQLTNMLTRVACEQKEGPFADFNLNEEQWEALRIAGGLHDCGKVTTPEYVVDKATKLETLHDRIHEVRMRFEVLKRDAEITCLKAIAAGGNESELQSALASELRTLDEEFAFIASCNEGGEFMEPEKVERLKRIACRTWQRTLDDRLGVSWEEAKRQARTPARPLPATEQLLADKPEHVIERQEVDLMSEHNPWGFKLQMPASLYNRGELYNLSIAHGTLNEEERYKINDHIVQTIMLSTLPFPKYLKTVAELAGGHHEKMDGTGYPKRLHRDEMSIPARIMAIADIFEALTAADRPYKKAKKLSEAIRIMSFMKKDRHIDPELFDLFLSSGVYLQYAEEFMQRDYIDEVDVNAYLGVPSSDTGVFKLSIP
jgi:HD-GYP domain-containing protein (c-di-GMP phosphodiesterase class II)